MARKKRGTPEVNAGSMADIAFLLLIFFLVTTTMDIDEGINRKLPPWNDENVDPPPIKEKNIFTVLVNSKDKLLVEDEYMEIKELRGATKRFLNNNGDGSCNYCVNSIGNPKSSDNPSKAIVSLQNDRGTSYDTYIAVQNELAAAYNELRNELAKRRYGTPYKDLPEAKKEQIQDLYPQKISEAEPVNL